MTLYFADKEKGSFYDSDYDNPRVVFECRHESWDYVIVMSLYHRVEAGLGVGRCASCTAEAYKEEAHRLQQNAPKRTPDDEIAKSVATSLEQGLTPLQGKHEQVGAAEKQRARLFQLLSRELTRTLKITIYTEQEKESAKELLDAVRAEMGEQTAPAWWLNPALNLSSLVRDTLQRLRESEPKRFGPSNCGHRNPGATFGLLQKALCKKCLLSQNKELPEAPSVAEQLKPGFPALSGAESQMVWASKIRERFLFYLVSLEKRRPRDKALIRAICQESLRQTSARWWLAQPNQREDGRDARDALYLHLRETILLLYPTKKPKEIPEATPVTLSGSEKQIVWANKIRQDFLGVLSRYRQSIIHEEQVLGRMIHQTVSFQSSAVWWIDSPSRQSPQAHLQDLMDEIQLPEDL